MHLSLVLMCSAEKKSFRIALKKKDIQQDEVNIVPLLSMHQVHINTTACTHTHCYIMFYLLSMLRCMLCAHHFCKKYKAFEPLQTIF